MTLEFFAAALPISQMQQPWSMHMLILVSTTCDTGAWPEAKRQEVGLNLQRGAAAQPALDVKFVEVRRQPLR